MSDKTIASRVASRFRKQAGSILPTENVVRMLESATFANGNGGITLSIYESMSPKKNGYGPYFSYYLHHRVSHFSASNEAEIQLGNSNMVAWLAESLARTHELSKKNESSWDLDFIGKPEVSWKSGENVEEDSPPPQTDGQSEG